LGSHIGFVFFVVTYYFVPAFHTAKFCGVPSKAIGEVGCAMGKRKVAEHWSKLQG
jgi:hypothetical protein